MVYLVGFIIEIYYDARSYKRKKSNIHVWYPPYLNKKETSFGLPVKNYTHFENNPVPPSSVQVSKR